MFTLYTLPSWAGGLVPERRVPGEHLAAVERLQLRHVGVVGVHRFLVGRPVFEAEGGLRRFPRRSSVPRLRGHVPGGRFSASAALS